MTRHLRISHLIIALAVCLPMVCGCQTGTQKPMWSGFNLFRPAAEKEPEYEQPVRMAVIWKETAVSAPGKKPTRGFGGRVYFYNEKREPVRVDGALTVYAFDDSAAPHEAQKSNIPERKYVFNADQLQQRFGKTDLGDSYNIWIPWDKVGGDQKTIALVPTFKPREGSIIQADQSIAVLPGKRPALDDPTSDQPGVSHVRQVAAAVPAGESMATASRLAAAPNQQGSVRQRRKATTIRVPRSLANRMKQLGPNSPAGGVDAEAPAPSPEEVAARQQLLDRMSGGNLTMQQIAEETTQDRKPVFGQPGAYR